MLWKYCAQVPPIFPPQASYLPGLSLPSFWEIYKSLPTILKLLEIHSLIKIAPVNC